MLLMPYCTRALECRSSDRSCVHEKLPKVPVLEPDEPGLPATALVSCVVSWYCTPRLNKSRGHSRTAEAEALVVRNRPVWVTKKLLVNNTGWLVVRSTVTPDELTVEEATAACRFCASVPMPC